MKVIDWVAFGDAVDDMPDCGIGGLGGWFGLQHTWADYRDQFTDAGHPYVDALRDSIAEQGLREAGDWHQVSDAGVPVFGDGTVAVYSYRAWGDLMAAVWQSVDGVPYRYMDFYYGRCTTVEEAREREAKGIRLREAAQ